MAANWWDEDKPAEWWAADKPAAPKAPASASLDTTFRTPMGGMFSSPGLAAFNVLMGERGQEAWDTLQKGGMGAGAILAELLPTTWKQRVQDAVIRRTQEIERADKESREPVKRLQEEFPGQAIAGPLAVDVAVPMGKVTKGAGVLRGALEQMAPGMIPGLLTRENQGQNAALTGGLTGAGSVVAGTVGRLLRPVDNVGGPGVDEAIRLGYELPAGVKTGSSKLQAVEAALESLPGTKPRLAEMRARNDLRTQNLTDAALPGGGLDQGNAGASAMRSYNEGVRRVLDESGAQYDELLKDRRIPIGGIRGDVQQVVARQQQIPASERSTKALDAANELLGTPGYAKKPPVPSSKAVDVDKDDLITAIRKKGGLDYDEFGGLADEITFGKSFDGPVYRGPDKYGRAQGVSRDRMAEMMANEGYIPSADPDLLVDAMERAAKGELIESAFKEYRQADPLADAIKALTERLDAKSAPKASPGFIRANPEIPGEVAQRMRSSYGAKAEAAFPGKVEEAAAYRGLRDAVDKAIDKALEGTDDLVQFQAVRERYGLAKAIESLKPTNQGEFLAKLYRGAKSPDQFYSWLGITDNAGFTDVRRGFLSQLIEKAKDTKTGEVSGAKLARALQSADPEALRVLGQAEGETLQRVARASPAAEFKFPTSGTSERSFNQRLFTNPLALYGMSGLTTGAAAGATGHDPYMGFLAGAGAMALPRAAQSVMFSKPMQSYLTQGLAAMTPAQRAAIARSGGLAGLGLASWQLE